LAHAAALRQLHRGHSLVATLTYRWPAGSVRATLLDTL
jgi:hypothetical protein